MSTLPGRIRRVVQAKTTEELATEFVLMATGDKRGGKLYRAQNLLDELSNRVDPVQLQIEIHQARETLQMLGLMDVQIQKG